MADFPNLTGAIEAALRDANDGDSWGGTRLHISDLGYSEQGGLCKRELKLRLQGAEGKPPTEGMMWLWDRGHDAEARVEQILGKFLAEGWRLKDWQVGIEYQGVKGTLDFLLEHEDETTCIIDCKTARGNAFDRLRNAPKESHVLQVSAYALATGADLAGLLYVDREGQNGFIQWEVVPDREAVDRAVEQIKMVDHIDHLPDIVRPSVTIRENKGPDSIYLKEKWTCSYCSYRDISCDGCLPPNLRDAGMVGHLDGGAYVPKKGIDKALVPAIRSALHKSGTTLTGIKP